MYTEYYITHEYDPSVNDELIVKRLGRIRILYTITAVLCYAIALAALYYAFTHITYYTRI
jgi:hypothetical protein